MHAVLYCWRVKPGAEPVFLQAWHEVTDDIRRHHGGGGSRLHRTENGDFIAYAR